jgi:site-specific recombinase XerC
MVGRPPSPLVGPLEPLGGEFSEWLAGSGLGRECRVRARGVFRALSAWLAVRGVALGDVGEEVLGSFEAAERDRVAHPAAEQYVPVVRRFFVSRGAFAARPPATRGLGGVPRLRVGPLADELPGFVEWLAARGYADGTAVSAACVLARFSAWLGERGPGRDAVDWAALAAFGDAERSRGHVSSVRRVAVARRFLEERGLLAAAPAEPPAALSPVAAEVESWVADMRRERGLAPGTLAEHRRWGLVLASELAGPDGRVEWDRATPELVARHMAVQGRGRAAATVCHLAASVRSLLAWAHASGRLARPVAGSVLSPKRPGPGLPKHLAADEAERLAAAAAGDPRGRALVALTLRLGLRAGEVAALTLDDVDWRAGSIRVEGKGRSLRLPLPADVGEALVAYLRAGRPDAAVDRRVFIRSRTPLAGLTGPGVSSAIARLGRAAGLGAVGAHRLRHTAATAVIARGGSLAEAGQLLGHASTRTTSVYARCDMASLGELVVGWGEAGVS